MNADCGQNMYHKFFLIDPNVIFYGYTVRLDKVRLKNTSRRCNICSSGEVE